MVRRWFYASSAVVLGLVVAGTFISPHVLWALVIVAPMIAIGLHDALQETRGGSLPPPMLFQRSVTPA